jgi:hypothetical protein
MIKFLQKWIMVIFPFAIGLLSLSLAFGMMYYKAKANLEQQSQTQVENK